MEKAKVYFTDMRTGYGGLSLPQKLAKLIKAAGIGNIDFNKKFAAIKIHFGEPGNVSYLRPNYAKAVADVVKEFGGMPFLTDCNTLYVGRRKHALEHITAAYENGFSPFSTGCHVIIADGLKGTDEAYVPVPGGEVVKEAKIDPELERKNIFLEHGVGYQLCNECLDDRNLANLTAFIGNNDMVSYGIMDAILKKGYQIPDDFSVCGFDNDFASSLLPISLTTVEHYMENKGKKAFDMIYEKIQEKDDFFVQDDKCVIRIEYKSKLISRDSTNVARTRKNINL